MDVLVKWVSILGLCLGLYLAAGLPAPADDVRTLKDLNELLQPDPYINLGSDEILTQLPEESASVVARGKAVYDKFCASCHGVNLQGQPNWQQPTASGLMPAPPHDRTGHTWHHADDQLFEYVKYGPAIALGDPNHRTAMPAFGSVLKDEEILAVLVYIRSSWPAEERSRQSAVNDDQSGR